MGEQPATMMPSTNKHALSIFSLNHYHVYDKKLTEVFASAAERLSISAAATIDIVTAGETDWTSNIPKINVEQQSDFSDGRGVGILDAMTFKNKRVRFENEKGARTRTAVECANIAYRINVTSR